MFCSRDDVVLLPIPFTDLSSSKVRPAIVVGHGSWPGDLLAIQKSHVFATQGLAPLFLLKLMELQNKPKKSVNHQR